MFISFYSNPIYLKLINIMLQKFNFEKNLVFKFLKKKFKFLFFKVMFINMTNKMQILSMPTYTDYGILFIMKSLLEEIFNFKILRNAVNNSFDFFNNIRKWMNVKWCLKGCFMNFLDKVDLVYMGQYLFKYTQDILILNLYFSFIAAGYLLKNTNLLFYYYFNKNNTFGFFLVEIYLYEFDKFMHNYINYFNVSMFHEKFFWKKNTFFYISFGFLWFLSINNSFNFVLILKKKLYFFIFNCLYLSLKKSDIQMMSLLSSSIMFLGVVIKFMQSNKQLELLCPMQALLLKFKQLGFLKYFKNKLMACAQSKWLALECSEIFWKYYLVKMRLFNFYFFVRNFSMLFILKYFLKLSLIFTLGRKFKLTKKQMMYKFKPSLVKWMS